MIEVFDDLLDDETLSVLDRVVKDPLFAWHYNSRSVEGIEAKDSPQMVRSILMDTGSEGHITSYQNELIKKYPEFMNIAWRGLERSKRNFEGIEEFLRIKVNMTMPFLNAPTFNPPHTDTDGEGYMSLVYYLNDSDGDTFFFDDAECFNSVDDRRVTPKRNRGVMFDAYHRHSSSSPKETRRRLIINSVFKPIGG